VTAVYVGLGVLVVLLLAVAISYNRFVSQRNLVRESWHQVDVELQRRHDLIPNLVETVKAYAAHERTVFERITELRAEAERLRVSTEAGPQAQAEAETRLARAMTSVLAVAEAYPALRASENFLDLQDQLAETEDRIAAARRFYNGNVRALNTRVESVPSNLVARMFGFGRAEYFETTQVAVRAPVPVDLANPGEP